MPNSPPDPSISWWPRSGERLGPLASGVLLALSYPPLHILVPPFVGLVPLALWLNRLPGDVEGRRSAMRGCLLFGAVYAGITLYWISIALMWFTKLAIVAILGILCLGMMMTAVLGWTVHHALNTLRLPLWGALPVAWTAFEWSRGHLPDTLAFPWLGLGSSLTGFPELVGFAEIVGSRGVTFWLALINGLIAGLVLKFRESRPWARQAVTIASVMVLPMGWGVWRAGTLESYEVARVAVVQPNISKHVKVDAEVSLDSTVASLDRLIPEIVPGAVNLVVMPEGTLQAFPECRANASLMDRMRAYSRWVGAPIVVGALGYEEGEPGGFTPFNSAFVMEPSGLIDFRYDKRYLVPFIERVPMVPLEWGWVGAGTPVDWGGARGGHSSRWMGRHTACSSATSRRIRRPPATSGSRARTCS